jgi:phospho-N-acetylmuramoyl-pentapeptide-transferase
MLYEFFKLNRAWLDRIGFDAWQNVPFRSVVALLTAFLLTVWLGPKLIRFLKAKKIGAPPDLKASVRRKADTPTMGGIIIVLAIFIATVLWADVFGNFHVQLGLFTMVWLAGLGGIDDWLRLTGKNPKTRRGLLGWEKLAFQMGLGLLIAFFAFGHGIDISESHQLTMTILFTKHSLVLSPLVFAIVTVIAVTGTSNAVNLTDGMDGLAAGCMAPVALVFMVLCLIVGSAAPVAAGQILAEHLSMPYIPTSDELAVFCGAILGGCVGFLRFNCFPAQVFMGDTGSLPLGGAIGYVAVVIGQELMLLIVGGVFVVEALSVILQVSYFKFTGGKRIFRSAPIHNHFHLGGWTEPQTVTRFWLIGAILAAVGLMTLMIR